MINKINIMAVFVVCFCFTSSADSGAKEPVYTIGDSITAGNGGINAHCTSLQRGCFNASENINHTYQYWLDRYLNSDTSAQSTSISGYNRGIGGQTCDEIYARFNSDIPDNSRVILMCGINDLYHGHSDSEIEEDIEQIYNLSESKNNTLVIMEILPFGEGFYCQGITSVNHWLSVFARSHPDISLVKVHSFLSDGKECFINYSLFEPDEIHPNIEGLKMMAYQIWNQTYNFSVYVYDGNKHQLTESQDISAKNTETGLFDSEIYFWFFIGITIVIASASALFILKKNKK